MKISEIKKGFPQRFLFENELKSTGAKYIAGIDEVGRGCLAGPVVACACILKNDFFVEDCFDSKQLSKKRRKELEPQIKDSLVCFAFGKVSATNIDKMNIYQATKIAMKMAVEKLSVTPDHLLIDAMTIDSKIEQKKIIHGDQKSNSIAAASILAKVYRDDLMKEYDKLYPGYGFSANMGYLTKQHQDALAKYGITPIHRRSFAPIFQKSN
ncbi:ribonuclease HII [Oenococcus alcoholitolerans]|uniref:ribonuclease HII n=1 Tax=Oenococcus alcoholitolerans TaxID=931074 RepID=UPI003F716B99